MKVVQRFDRDPIKSIATGNQLARLPARAIIAFSDADGGGALRHVSTNRSKSAFDST